MQRFNKLQMHIVYMRKQEELIKNVAQNYLQIGTAQEYIKVAQQGLKEANEHLRIAKVQKQK